MSVFRLFDIFFGHFVDKLDQGIVSEKDVGVFKCLSDQLSDIPIDDLTPTERTYHRKLIEQFDQISNPRIVGQISTKIEAVSIKLHDRCSNNILTRQALQEVHGQV